MRAVLTPEDLKKGDLIDPGWYKSTILRYEEAMTKDNTTTGKKSDGSMNAIFVFRLDEGPNTGAEVKRYFNEKALGFGKDLYAALEFPKNAADGYDLSSELFKSTEGSKLEIYVKRGIGNDKKEFNEVSDFRKMR